MNNDRLNNWLATVLLCVGIVCFATLFLDIVVSARAAHAVLRGCK